MVMEGCVMGRRSRESDGAVEWEKWKRVCVWLFLVSKLKEGKDQRR